MKKNKYKLLIIIVIIFALILSMFIINKSKTELIQLKNNGHSQMMGYVIKTDNNKVIVIDGGTQDDIENLKKTVNKYTGKIDFWFITHPHKDHATCFVKMVENTNVDIGKVYVTVNDEDWYKKYADGRENECIDFLNALKNERIKDKVEEVYVNQKIYIDNIDCEILGIKNPEITENAVNNQSMVIKMNTGKNSILFLGDTGVQSANKLLQNQKNKLKSDIVQVAHHGQSGANKELYEVVKPKICLWPTPDWLWNNDSGTGEDTGTWKTKETRQWMKELNVKENYIEKDGNIKIQI